MKEYQLVMVWGTSQIDGKVFDNLHDAMAACDALNSAAIRNGFPMEYRVREQ